MSRTIKKEINLNKLKSGCSPCMSEAKKMEQKISNREVSEIKIEEVKVIVSSMFKKDWKFDVNFSGSMQAILYTLAALARELYMLTVLRWQNIIFGFLVLYLLLSLFLYQ